jgi:hypothetical protein
MKSLVKIIMFFLIVPMSGCSSVEVKNDAKVAFENIEYDFGEITYNDAVDCNFKFTNTGKTALIIQNVKSSCGCSVPEWVKKPIPPGKKSEIKINYDTSYPGVFNKTITVFYNGIESPQTLTIKGSVQYPGNFKDNKKEEL